MFPPATASPLYPAYSGHQFPPQTGLNSATKSFKGAVGTVGASPLPSAISNMAQASSSLPTDKLRQGSEFSFFPAGEPDPVPPGQRDSSDFKAMDWYQ